MIQVKNLTFGHIGQPLYHNASFSVPKNKKAGLVGLNGAGKSTLFQLLLGDEYPEDGSIRTEGKVVLVPQEVSHDPVQEQADSVFGYLQKARKINENHAREYLDKMELTDVALASIPKDLSGGQKTKLAILFAILSEPDVLLLDEPTNFMDTAGKKWVMHWLSGYKKTLLVVSHDLDLLDKAIDKVVYINKQTKQFEEYTGNYSQFKKLKSNHDEHLIRHIKNEEQHIKRMEKSLETLRRSNVEKVVRRRVQLEKRIQQMKDMLPPIPKEIVHLKLVLPVPAHIGSLPILIKDVSKSYDDKRVLKKINFSIERGQRIALIGKNGVGKSTLIHTILGLENIDSGEIKLDERVKIGYYSQEFESLDMQQTLFSLMQSQGELNEGQIRSFLHGFMFTGDKLKQQVYSLSGGEKTRLSIALLMLQNYNFLILDEPTTYLDVLSQRIILEALKQYKGTMLVVSHTPDFLKELRPEKAFLLPEEKMVYWNNELADRSAEM